jgi:Branched-chain amino acid transport protein (AzlD)
MTAAWVTIGVLCVATVAMKASGPAALRGRRPSRRALAVIALVAPAVLASLVLYQTFGETPSGITADARLAGVAVAALAIALRAPMLVVVAAAALATALARALA